MLSAQNSSVYGIIQASARVLADSVKNPSTAQKAIRDAFREILQQLPKPIVKNKDEVNEIRELRRSAEAKPRPTWAKSEARSQRPVPLIDTQIYRFGLCLSTDIIVSSAGMPSEHKGQFVILTEDVRPTNPWANVKTAKAVPTPKSSANRPSRSAGRPASSKSSMGRVQPSRKSASIAVTLSETIRGVSLAAWRSNPSYHNSVFAASVAKLAKVPVSAVKVISVTGSGKSVIVRFSITTRGPCGGKSKCLADRTAALIRAIKAPKMRKVLRQSEDPIMRNANPSVLRIATPESRPKRIRSSVSQPTAKPTLEPLLTFEGSPTQIPYMELFPSSLSAYPSGKSGKRSFPAPVLSISSSQGSSRFPSHIPSQPPTLRPSESPIATVSPTVSVPIPTPILNPTSHPTDSDSNTEDRESSNNGQSSSKNPKNSSNLTQILTISFCSLTAVGLIVALYYFFMRAKASAALKSLQIPRNSFDHSDIYNRDDGFRHRNSTESRVNPNSNGFQPHLANSRRASRGSVGRTSITIAPNEQRSCAERSPKGSGIELRKGISHVSRQPHARYSMNLAPNVL